PCAFRASTACAGTSRRARPTDWKRWKKCLPASRTAARDIVPAMTNEHPTERPMPDTTPRIFGGSPLAVLGRLILVSVLVGVILSVLGLDPFDIVHSLERLIRSLWDMGFD